MSGFEIGDLVQLAEHSLTGLMAFTMLVITNSKLIELSKAIDSLREEVHLLREGTRR